MTITSRLISVILSIILVACSSKSPSLIQASAEYKQTKDYTSLIIIHDYLDINMPRKQVESLLGKPDYSPTDGLYFYSSNQRIFSEEQNTSITYGLIVDYRNNNDVITDFLQKYSSGPIAE